MNIPTKNRLAGLALALAVLISDQLSKSWVLHGLDLPARGTMRLLPFLNFTMVWNHGITFGLLTSHGALAPFLLGALALAVVCALGYWLWRSNNLLTSLPIGAIAGGAIGNVIDRLRYGAVVDFVHAHAFGYSWYVFNLADAAIVCGVGALMFDSFRHKAGSEANSVGPN